MATNMVMSERRPHRTLNRLPTATRDVAQGIKDLREHGVALHEGFVTDEFADRLRERLEEQAYMERKLGLGLIGGPAGLNDTPTFGIEGKVRTAKAGETAEPIYQVVQSLVNKGRVFMDLVMNEIGHTYANAIFGQDPWNLWGLNGIITRRGALEQFLHVDSGTVPQDMLTRAVQINCFICVTDFDLEMGPTGLVPGSHLGDRPHYDGDEKRERYPAVAKKGTAIIWDGRTWHGQMEHRSDRTRYSIAMTYCLYAIRGGENYPASLQDRVLETLTEEELRVLGFQTQMVGSMNGFGPRNPNDKHHGIGYSPNFIPELHRDE
jgi:hypothetical protein